MSAHFGVVPLTEKCAVWEVGPLSMRGAMIEITAGKRLRIGGRWQRKRGERLPGEFLRIPNLRSIPLVLSLHPAIAYTAILPFRKTFAKDSVKGHRAEFQAMIRELMDRTSLELRVEAARRLGVEDLDAVLFDARVTRLTVSGEEVTHRLPDLAGKELRGMFHVVFTSRPVFHDLHDLLHSGKELFVTSRGKASLAFLERVAKAGPFRLIDLSEDSEEYATLSYKEELPLRESSFPWQASLDKLLAEEWAVSSSAAAAILAAAERGGASGKVMALLDRLQAESVAGFEKALGKMRLQGTAYVRHAERLPFPLPRAFGRAALLPYPFEAGFHELGFEMAAEKWPRLESLLLPFLEYYYHRGDPVSHKALTRQIHWIKQ